MLRDLKTKHAVEVALNITAISSDTTTDGETIDLQGKSGCLFTVFSGTLTDGSYTPIIEESATGSFGGEETAVADADLIGTEAGAALALTDDNSVKTVGYIGDKRYVRITIVSASTTSGGTVGAVAHTLKEQTA